MTTKWTAFYYDGVTAKSYGREYTEHDVLSQIRINAIYSNGGEDGVGYRH